MNRNTAPPKIRKGHYFAKMYKMGPRHYLLQTLLSIVVVFIIVLLLKKERIVVISAMGATTFIIFAMPKAQSAQTRNVIGGHLVGLAAGTLFYFLELPYFISYPLAVGLTIFLMLALSVEHAPAAGTALAVVINEVCAEVFVTIMLSALVLSQVRYYLRKYLKDLV